MFLYQKLDTIREIGATASVPNYISENLNPNFELRPYQITAFENFITYYEGRLRQKPTQVLFHMATGSGKTLIMAGLMLYLYKKGYRNFLFFVNLSNIVEKTKDNFNNHTSSKYLFADEIVLDGEHIRIQEVSNFQNSSDDCINICFTTTQGLHSTMWFTRENGISIDDFDNCKVVLISDEAHHLNVDTKKKMSSEEEESYHSWEETVNYIFRKNPDNVLLEFTATCDLENINIRTAYEDKIIFDYALNKFYQDKYSKDILTLRSDLPLIQRVLQALVLSQYRLKVFQDQRLSIKPVILFKAAKIIDSKQFMTDFIQTIHNISASQIQNIAETTTSSIVLRAFKYFADKGISYENLAQELKEDFSESHCVSVNDDEDATQKQILLNSLEDITNPYRAIFEVKKLDEGWDVLNLFDIVRLYETRQSGGKKISPATIAEAQLIGRGARYCPFQLDMEQPRFQRKYDEDVENEIRVCEQLYYHCQNDHKYISELHAALREIGLDPDKVVKREYVLKESFKNECLYNHGLIFINDREVISRDTVTGLQPTIHDNIYTYQESSGISGTDIIMNDIASTDAVHVDFALTRIRIKDIADINYAIVNKALMKFPVFKFNTLKSYFPNVKSTREFVTKDEYLGGIKIDIRSTENKPSVSTMHNAVFSVLEKVAVSLSGIEETYRGTKEFKAQKICDVFKNKTVNYTVLPDGGVGVSQNDISVRRDWKIDLSKEDWFAYTDNYGTSEEKAFVAYFRDYVSELKQQYSKIFLIRNEREFHLYSFDNGERFEPDYVLFLQSPKSNGYEQLQIFIEPKGSMLLEKDSWKESFLLQMRDNAIPVKVFADDNDYRIWGLHFFNTENRMKEFNSDFETIKTKGAKENI